MKKAVYFLWQCLWGAPQTLVGLFVFLRWCRQPHFRYHGALVTVWDTCGGISLGLFVFIPASARQPARSDEPAPGSYRRYSRILSHEYGHTLQSLLLGPLYLPVIGIPSWLWCNLPPLRRWRKRTGTDYDSLYTERWATAWGRRMAHRTGEWWAVCPQELPEPAAIPQTDAE